MKVEIFDPAMCCPTGICGPAVDPALVRMNDAVMMLQRQSVDVVRFGLAQQTKVFLENKTVADLLQAQGKKALPITLVNGVVFRTGAYPSYEELCAALGIAPQAPPVALPMA